MFEESSESQFGRPKKRVVKKRVAPPRENPRSAPVLRSTISFESTPSTNIPLLSLRKSKQKLSHSGTKSASLSPTLALHYPPPPPPPPLPDTHTKRTLPETPKTFRYPKVACCG